MAAGRTPLGELITRRSWVQIPPPLLAKGPLRRAFLRSGRRSTADGRHQSGINLDRSPVTSRIRAALKERPTIGPRSCLAWGMVKTSDENHLLILGISAGLAWVLRNSRMAFPR